MGKVSNGKKFIVAVFLDNSDKINPMSILQNEPHFIPKTDEKLIVQENLDFDYIMVPASLFYRRNNEKNAQRLTDYTSSFIIPESNRLIKNTAKNQSIEMLPYNFDESKITELFSNPTYRLETVERPCVKFQHNKGADFIIAPYFQFDGFRNQVFSTNLNMVQDSSIIMQDENIQKPFMIYINLSADALSDPSSMNFVRSRYLEDMGDKIDGVIISIDNMDDRYANEDVLLGLARFVHDIGSQKPTVVCTIGGFGEVLCAVGASAYSSGLMTGEVHAMSSYDRDGYGRRRNNESFYVPELFNYMKVEDLEEIGYRCNYPTTDSPIPSEFKDKKIHQLYNKKMAADQMKGMTREERIQHLLTKINDGKRLAQEIRSKHGGIGLRNTGYLDRWKAVLERAAEWPLPDREDDETEELIAELE